VTPGEITKAIGPLLDQLADLGIRVTGSRYDADSFGDFYVDCRGAGAEFRIVRERGQYFLEGDAAELRQHGLFKAYDSVQEFMASILRYAKARG